MSTVNALAALNTLPVSEAARTYIKLGFRPIPLHPFEKAPKTPGWPELVIKTEEVDTYFADGDNIGVVLGQGLVDIDLDSPQALQLASDFLTNDCMFGRTSRPRSHRLFHVHQALKS